MNYSTNFIKIFKRLRLILSLFFILLFSNTLKAQLDYIHYVPPFYAGAVNSRPSEGYSNNSSYTYPDGETVFRGSWCGDHMAVLTTPNSSDNPITVIVKNGRGEEIGRITDLHTGNPQMFHLGSVYNNNNNVLSADSQTNWYSSWSIPDDSWILKRIEYDKYIYGDGWRRFIYNVVDPNNIPYEVSSRLVRREYTRIQSLPTGVILANKLNKRLATDGLIFESLPNENGKKQPFYVNIRHKTRIHGFSLTTKGQAAFGNNFYSGHLRGYSGMINNQSHFISVMATKDNTSVTFDNNRLNILSSSNDPNNKVTFIDKRSISFDGSTTINLNKGESYVFAVDHGLLNSESDIANFNGTHVTSTNPIVVNTGSWCSSVQNGSQDIGVDQIVPASSLGREYVVIKGDGGSLSYLIERPLVVATADDTKIYLNQETTGTPDFTLTKAGDYKYIESNNYNGDIMYVKSSKDIYMYQPTASDNKVANVGFNFIPPLTALGLRQVDIPFINQVGTGKILITAMNGEDVFMNNKKLTNPIPALGSKADSRWWCYIESNVPDKVKITSKKTIAVALSVKDRVVGAAGYFSGFTKFVSPLDPDINVGPDKDLNLFCKTTGENVELAPDAGSDFVDVYRWYSKSISLANFIGSDPSIIKPISLDQVYFLESFYADPTLDIYNYGDFDNDLAFWSTDYNDEAGSFEGKYEVARLVKNPRLASSNYIEISDYYTDDFQSITHNMLLVSCGKDTKEIWKSDGIPVDANEDYIFKAHAIYVEEDLSKGQVLQLFVNDVPVGNPVILNRPDINGDGKYTVDDWQSFAGVWNSGSETMVSLCIKNMKTGVKSAVAIDRIMFSRAIKKEDSIEVAVSPPVSNPLLNPEYFFCEGLDLSLEPGFTNIRWFTYEWTRLNGDPILESNVTGKNNPILKITNANEDNEGDYQLTIIGSSACGKDNGDKKTYTTKITMTRPVSFNTPDITTALCEGKDIDFDLNSATGGINNIQWYKNDVEIPGANGLGKDSGALLYRYTANMADENPDAVNLKCIISGTCPDAEWNANIDVLETIKITKPIFIDGYNFCEDEIITLKVGITGVGTIKYEWFRSDVSMGSTSVPEFSFTAAQNSGGNNYHVIITTDNSCDAVRSNLVNKISINNKVKIKDVRETGSSCEETSHTFIVDMYDGSDISDETIENAPIYTKYTYEWYHDNVKIPGEEQSQLYLESLKIGDSGVYKVRITNSCNYEEREFPLTVIPKPRFTSELKANPSGTYCPSDRVVISIEANASVENYTWTLPDGTTQTTTLPTLTLNPIGDKGGEYTVVANNSCTVSSTERINLVIKPSLNVSVPKPIINICDGDIEAQLAVAGNATSFQWYKGDGAARTKIEDATNRTYIITNPIFGTDDGIYTCDAAGDVCGTKTLSVNLSINKVTSSDIVQTVCAGTDNTLSIDAVGDYTYQWYKIIDGDTSYKIIDGETSNTLNIVSARFADNGLYKCILTSDVCPSKEIVGRFTVIKRTSVNSFPTSAINLCSNAELKISPTFTGKINSIKWYKDDALLPDFNELKQLYIDNISSADSGIYKIVVEGKCDDVTKSIDVQVYDEISIAKLNQNISICENETLTITPDVKGSVLAYQWYFNNTIMPKQTNKVLSVAGVSVSNTGLYKLIATSVSCVSEEIVYTVSVRKVLVSSGLYPYSSVLCPGESIILSPNVVGDGLSYSWTFKGLDKGKDKILQKDNFLSKDEGEYILNISSDFSCGNPVVLKANLSLAPELKIITNPIDISKCVGEKAEFSVDASGNGNLTYQWRKNGDKIIGETNSSFVIPAVDMSHNDNYYSVDIKDKCSGISVLSSTRAKLTVYKKTNITSQPISKTVLNNSEIELSVSTEGNTVIAYQWQKKNAAGDFVDITSENSDKLKIVNLQLADNGNEYRVLISSSNKCDDDIISSIAIITVREKIKITTNINDISVCENENAILSVETNIADATYQWRINTGSGFVDLINSAIYENVNTKNLTINNPNDSFEPYEYMCFINAGVVSGDIDSEKAQITVNKIPSLNSIADQTICSDASINIDINVDADNIANYNLVFPDKTNSTFNVSKIILANADIQVGEYTLSVIASCGTPERKFNISYFPELNLTNFDSSDLCSSEGDRLLSSTPSGHGPFEYTWKKGTKVLSTGNVNEGENITYSLDNLSEGKSGNYVLLVTDACNFSKTINANIKISDPAKIINPNAEVYTICSNSSKTLNIEYTGTDVDIQWLKDGVDLAKNTPTISVSEDGIYTAKLTTDAICDSAPEKTFTIIHYQLPSVSDPVDVFLCENEQASFLVDGTTYTGGNISYQWYNSGGLITGATEKNYSFIANDAIAQNASQYYCIITDDCGLTSKSNKASLYVNTPAIVITKSKEVHVDELSSVDLSFTHTGIGTYTYQWSLASTDLTDGAEYTGVNTASLHINKITADYQARKYICTIKNTADGACVENTIIERILKIKYGKRVDIDASNATVCENTATSFTLVLNTDFNASKIQWQVNKTGADDDWVDLSNNADYAGVTTIKLDISSVTSIMKNYRYRTNIDSDIEFSKEVYFNFREKTSLSDITGPDNICDNAELRLNANATGFGIITYAWTLGTDAAFSANTKNLVVAAGDHAEGTYTLTVSTICGSISKDKNVLHYQNLAITPLEDKTFCSTDADFTLNADITGQKNADGAYLYSWTKDGEDIGVDADAKTYTVISEKSNSGLYSVTAVGMCGSISSEANITYEDPIIVNTTKETITICNNSSTTLDAAATGDNIQYSWTNKLDDTNILSTDKNYDVTLAGTYVLNMTSTVCASNFTKEFEVLHYDELVITQHPADLVLCEGEEAVFSALATGAIHNLGIQYQWYDATDTALPGEINTTYTIAAVQESDNNKSFYCKITDDCGKELNTNVASLIVNTLAEIKITSKTQAVNERNNIALVVNTSGLGVYTYQWKLNGADITEATPPLVENYYTGTNTNTLTISNVSFDINKNNYICTVTNTAICGGSADASRIVTVLPGDRIQTQAADVLVCEDTAASFTLVLNAPYDAPDPIYGTTEIQWQVNKIGDPADWQDIVEAEGYTNSTSLILGITEVDLAKRDYLFRAIIDAGADISDEVKFIFRERVKITELTDKSLCKAAILSETVTATAYGDISYSWIKPDGTEISTNPTMIDNSTVEGEYTVVVTGEDVICPAVDEKFRLSHYVDLVISEINDIDICKDDDVDVTITQTAGTDKLTGNIYTWTHNGNPIVNNTNTFGISTADKATHDGLYKVSVEAMCGTESKSFNVVVKDPLVLTDNSKASVIKCIGANEVLEINPTGDDLSFSWTKDGVDIAGAINNSISVSDPATYIVTVVSSEACKKISSSKTFEVKDKQNLNTTDIAEVTVCENDNTMSFTYPVNAISKDDAQIDSYQWYKLNAAKTKYEAIIGQTTNTYNIIDVAAANNGDTYYCEVIDDCGKSYNSNVARLNVVPKLVINNPSTDVTVAELGTVVLTAIAADDTNLTYKWYFKNNVGDTQTALKNETNTDGVEISGIATKQLTLKNIPFSYDGKIYTCIVTNNSPCIDELPAVFNLSVIQNARILLQPSDIEVCLLTTGNKFEANTKTILPLPILQWEVSMNGGVNFFTISSSDSDYSGATTNTLTVNKEITATMISKYRYRLVADKVIVNENSSVVGFIENKAVSFLSTPIDKQLCIGEGLDISAEAQGHTTTGLVYTWTLPDASTVVSENLSLLPDDVQVGTYKINVTGGTCGPKSQSIEVEKYPDLSISGLNPDTDFCKTGGNNKINITANTPATLASLSYKWTGVGITGSAIGSEITVNPDDLANEGTYTVTVSDLCTTKKASTYLKIIEPITIASDLSDIGPLCKDDATEFSIIASGDARYPLTYEWKKNPTTTNTDVGSDDASYTINNVQTADAGNYQVNISDANDACPNISSRIATLSLKPIMTIVQADPQDACVNRGEVSFTIEAKDPAGAVSYQWYKDDVEVDASNLSAKKATLIIANTTMADKAYYHCVISDECSTINSNKVLLNLFTDPILSLAGTIEVNEDSNVTLSIENTGVGLFSYEWTLAGVPITDLVKYSGITTKNLTINGVKLIDNDNLYTCEVINTNTKACGANSNSITLKVKALDRIDVQAKNAEVCEGDEAKFSLVSAKGISFLWQESIDNGITWTDITTGNVDDIGVGSELTVSAVSIAMRDNKYRVIVDATLDTETISDEVGFVFKENVRFTPLPDLRICNDAALNINVNATGAGVLSYKWEYDGTSTEGASNLLNLSSPNAGSYKLKVTGECSTKIDDFTLSNNVDVVASGLTFDAACADAAASRELSVLVNAASTGKINGSGDKYFDYKWYKDGVEIPGATSDKYTIPSLALNAEARYSVEVFDNCISAGTSVYANIHSPIVVTSENIAYADVCMNTNRTLSVKAVGDIDYPLVYTWTNGAGAVVGNNVDTYTLLNITKNDTYNVAISVVSNDYACFPKPVTRSGDIIVQENFVVKDLPTVSVCEGGNTTFTVELEDTTGAPITDLSTYSFQWLEKGNVIDDETNSSLTLSGISVVKNNYNYSCIVTDDCKISNQAKTSALLRVFQNPSIASQTGSVLAFENNSASMSVTISGNGTYSYQWQEDSGSGFKKITDITNYTGFDTNELIISVASVEMYKNKYRCIVTNESGPCGGSVTSLEIELKITLDNRIDKEAENITLCEDTPASFAISSAIGKTFQWQVNKTGDDADWIDIDAIETNYSGENTIKLDIAKVDINMRSYIYRVIVDRDILIVKDGVSASVGFIFKENAKILSILNDIKLCPSEELNIDVEATAHVRVNYTWTYPVDGKLVTQPSTTNSILNLPNPEDGDYTLVVNGDACKDVTDTFIVSHGSNITLSDIASTPICEDISGANTYDLTITASGTPKADDNYSYVWKKDGIELTTDEAKGASTYTITGKSTDQEGKYSVDVSGKCVSATSNTIPVVIDKPLSIQIDNLDDIEICRGERKTLFVNIQGDTDYPIVYTWTNSAGGILGDNSSLDLNNIQSTETYKLSITSALSACNDNISSKEATISLRPDILIQQQADNGIICEGESDTFTIKATGAIFELGSALTYQWYKDGEAIVEDANNAEYTVNNAVAAKDAGTYYCVVSDDCDKTIQSQQATLLVNTKPVFTIEADDKTVVENSTVIFTSQADVIGTIAYQWYESTDDGLNYTALVEGGNYSGVKTTSLTIDNVLTSDSGNKYKLQATSIEGCSDTDSKEILLTVLAETTINIDKGEQVVCDGSSVEFMVSTNVPATYQWQVSDGTGFVDILADPADNYEGETTQKLRVIILNLANSTLLYRCVADGGDVSGKITSDPMGVVFKTNVSINTISDDITICPSESAIFNVDAQGSDISKYIWTLPDGSKLENNISILDLDSGNANKGIYKVEVVGTCKNASSEIEISHYKEPKIVSEFNSDIMCLNQGERILSVDIDGELPFTYTWFKNDGQISTDTSYTIPNTDDDDAGLYKLIATSAHCGSVSVTRTIKVSKPVIVNKNWDDTYNVCIGSDISFVSEATGDNLIYTWYHDDKIMPGETNSILNIKKTDLLSAGIYKCEISNPECGSDFISTNLIIDKITKIISLIDTSKDICEESKDENISIDVEGANINYTWSFNDGTGDIVVGDNSNNYTLPLFTDSSQGRYTVEVSGSCGSDSKFVDYSIIHLVKPISELKDVVVCEGSDHTMEVYYSGDVKSYLWKSNGNIINGATTNKYTINTALYGDDKTYTCEVTPVCGEMISSSALLEVTQATKLVNPLRDLPVCENNDIQLSVVAEGKDLVYNWQFNGSDIVSETNSLFIDDISYDKSGLYTLSIKGVCGTKFTSSYVEVVKQTVILKDLPVTIEKCESEQLYTNFNVDGYDLKYTWKKDAYPYSKANNNFLEFRNIYLSDAGIYSVEVQGLCGDVKLQTEVKVNGLVNITKKLTNQSVCENNEVVFSVEAMGADLKYQWFKGKNKLSEVSNTLTLASATISDIGVYRCIVTGSCGQKETIAELNVMRRPEFINHTISDITVCESYDIITLSAEVEGDDLSYQWKKDGVDIPDAIYDTYTIIGIELSDDAEYSLLVTSPCGDEVLKKITKLNVTPILTIESVSNGQELCLNEELNINIVAKGDNLKYQWRFNGVDMVGETKPSLHIASIKQSEGGIYNCIVNGECSSTTASRSIPVIVNILPDAEIFGRVDVCSGEERVVFQIGKVKGYSYSWDIVKGDFYDKENVSKVSTNWNTTGENTLQKGKLLLNLVIDRTGCAARVDSIIKIHPLPNVSVADMMPIGACFEPVELKTGLLNKASNEGGIYWINGVSEKYFDPAIYGSGSFPIRYSFTDSWGCSNISDEKFITVAKKPTIELVDNIILASCKTSQLDTLSTSGTLLKETVRWNNSINLSNRTIYNPIFTPGESGIYTIEAKDKYNCIAKDFIEIEVAPLPDVTTINDTIVGQCGNLMLKAFTDTDDFESINWSNPDHLDNPQSLTPRLELNVPTGTHNYKVDIVDVYGCTSSNNVNVKVMANPELGVPVITGCEGDELIVDLTSNPLAKWVDPETNLEDLEVTDYPVRVINKIGHYKVIEKNQYNCSDEQSITIRPIPNIDFTFDLDPVPEKWELFQKEMRMQGDSIYTIFEGEKLIITPNNLDGKYSPYIFEWKKIPEDNPLEIADISILSTYEINQSGKYSLLISDMPIDNKVCSSTKKFRVVVKPEEIISPNAFKPECGDGVNDKFYLKDIHFVKDYEMQIFNRWGQLLFSTKEIGYAGGWNGNFKGVQCPLGAYNWMAFSEGKLINKGSFLLFR